MLFRSNIEKSGVFGLDPIVAEMLQAIQVDTSKFIDPRQLQSPANRLQSLRVLSPTDHITALQLEDRRLQIQIFPHLDPFTVQIEEQGLQPVQSRHRLGLAAQDTLGPLQLLIV